MASSMASELNPDRSFVTVIRPEEISQKRKRTRYCTTTPVSVLTVSSCDEDSPQQSIIDTVQSQITNTKSSQRINNDDNPFGLKVEAVKWLMAEQRRYGSGSDDQRHSPYDADKKDIPAAHWERAYAEYQRRLEEYDTKIITNSIGENMPLVLLVATNVKDDWVPGEELLKAKYLFFPNLEYNETTTSALFITYMPGPVHGTADRYVSYTIGHWIFSNVLLEEILDGGLSSGSSRNPQPDMRVFPHEIYRDGNDDKDIGNGNRPYSHVIWEVEWTNRGPVDIRKNGKQLMGSPYNRLYLAAKFYELDADNEMEAAMVIWGRNETNDNDIYVIKAVSFGGKDLSDNHKQDFAKKDINALVAVLANQWVRVEQTDSSEPYMLEIPLEQILYKICYLNEGQGQGEIRYLTDAAAASTIDKLKINLRKLYTRTLEAAKSGAKGPPAKRAKVASGSDSA